MKKIDSLNLVPFIDIMLVLLVVVLTTASFINTNRIQVSVPKISDGATSSSEKKKSLNLAIDSSGKYFLENVQISLEDLESKLADYQKDTPIILNGDSNSNLDSFVKLMELLQKEDLNELYIVVEEEK